MAPSYDNLPTEDGFEDEEDEIDFSDLDAQREVRLDEGYDTFVIIDGLPKVPEDSKSKLLKFVLRKLTTVGKTSEEMIYMPVVDGMTEGYAFVEYGTAEQAVQAVKQLHGVALDKRHTMAVNKITDIERYGREGRINDEYVEPEIEPFKEKEHLRWWLNDAEGRDQFVMFATDNVGIYWNQREDAPESIVDRKHWTETFTAWSPLGVYLASMHMQGVQLWGGPSWTRMKRFPHPGVNLIDFSPNENYITTWSHRPITVDEGHPVLTADEEGANYIIWDIATGKPLRSFKNIEEASKTDDQGNPIKKKLQWPAFKWSADDKYVARLNPGQSISIYELPRMVLLDKATVKIDGIVDFEWAPATPQRDGVKTYEQLLCFWTPEIGSNPAKVGLMSIPSKEIVRTRNLFNVSDAKLHWQSQAKYVCVKVDRHSKSKKSLATNLEIFRIREKGVPVEEIDSLKDTVINFAWEPQGDRFVIITAGEAVAAQGAAAPKTSISFFCPEKAKGNAPPGNFRHIRTLEKRNSNGIYWSPKGRFVVIATVLSQLSSELEFFDCDFEGEKDEKDKDLSANLQSMALGDHYGVTDVDWDPTGRYVASSASMWKNAMETGYHVYNSTGTLLREESVPQFKQFSWRPRPPTLLTKEEQKQVRRNLREYSKQFDAQDEAKKSSASKELIEQRRRLVEEWRSWREKLVAELREMREEYGVEDVEEVRKAEAEEEGEAEVEEIVEEILKETEEVVD